MSTTYIHTVTLFLRRLACVWLIALLAACGGGGDRSKHMGAYLGSTSQGLAYHSILLPDNTYWSIVGVPLAGGGIQVTGALTGIGKLEDSTFSTDDAKGLLYVPSEGSSPVRSAIGLSVVNRFLADDRVTGEAITARAGTISFAGSRAPVARFDYDAAPSVAPLVGRWDGAAVNQVPAYIVVQPDGRFDGAIGACAYSGLLKPHPSGVNVLSASLLVGPPPCTGPFERFEGIGVSIGLEGGRTQLVLVGLDLDHTSGIAFHARR